MFLVKCDVGCVLVVDAAPRFFLFHVIVTRFA